MRVLAINFGDEKCASSYYRVWQFREPLREAGIGLEGVAARDFSRAHALGEYDVVLVQKKLFAVSTTRGIRRKSKRLIYDLDDALWAPQSRRHHLITRFRTNQRLKAISRAADLCLTANDVLAQKLRGWGARTTVFPMALDERIWTIRQSERLGSGVRVGWSGGAANLRYLEAIEPALLQAQAASPNLELVVHCGQRPKFKSLQRYTHIPFTGGEEPAVVRSFDIGLAPLPDNEFAAGKSPIKCIQYMATGVAPVVSPIGATRAMFIDGRTGVMVRSLEDWQEALVKLAKDSKLRAQIGANARAEFESNYALGRQAAVLAEILRSPG
jgi:hypothetical protein